jgi:hypothetical protein
MKTQTIHCTNCNEEVARTEYETLKYKNNFCSQECHYEWRKKNKQGDNHPLSKAIYVNCDICYKEIRMTPKRLSQQKHTYCSIECKNKGKSKFSKGPKMIDVNCSQCNIEYKIRLSKFNKNNKRSDNPRFFCSKDCSSKYWSENFSGENSGAYKGKIKCICEYCGNDFEKLPCHHKRSERHFCSKKCKGLARRGSHKKGYDCKINELLLIIRQSFSYLDWRKKCFEKQDYTCIKCNQVGGKLEVHHINPFKVIMKENEIENIDDAESCQGLWNINNGAVMCKKCHKDFHDEYGRHFVTAQDFHKHLKTII